MWVNIAGNLGMMFEMPFFVLHFQTRSWLQLRESRSTSFDSFPFTTSESYAYRTVKTGCVRTRGFTNNSQERQLKTTFPPCVIALSLCCIKIWIIVYLKDLPLTFACSKVMFDQTSTDLVQETTVRVLPMLNSETNLTTTLFSYRTIGYWWLLKRIQYDTVVFKMILFDLFWRLFCVCLRWFTDSIPWDSSSFWNQGTCDLCSYEPPTSVMESVKVVFCLFCTMGIHHHQSGQIESRPKTRPIYPQIGGLAKGNPPQNSGRNLGEIWHTIWPWINPPPFWEFISFWGVTFGPSASWFYKQNRSY